MANEQLEEPPILKFLEFRREKRSRSIALLAKLQGIEQIIDLVGDGAGGWLDEQILLLNPDKLMGDILDRLEALKEVQWAIKNVREKSGLKDDHKKENALVDIKNKVFIAAASMTMTKLGQSPWSENDDCCDIVTMLHAFPDETKLTDERDCLLTHWAMLAVARPEYDVSVADVKALVTRDPMSMRKHHLTGLAAFQPGLTPAQFLCMQEESESVMALVRHYAIYNPTAFTMCASYPRDDSAETDCDSAIHAACCAHCPSVELLQLLIQLDPSQATKKASRYSFTPLAQLHHCAIRFRKEGTKFNDAVQCLLAADSSAEYIGDALCGLLYGCCRSKEWAIEDAVASMQQQVLDMMDMLLAINPDAAKYRPNGWNLLHHIADIPSTMPPILALHADAVRERCTVSGCFPVHIVARQSSMEVMEFLLGMYPESATASIFGNPNILIYLIRAAHPTLVVVDLEAKLRFLCSRFSELVHQQDDRGYTALVWEFSGGKRFRLPVVKILCEVGGRDLVSAPYNPPLPVDEEDDQGDDDDDNDDVNLLRGWLPLHMFISANNPQLRSCLPFSDEANCLRTLLHWYPEAVGTEAGVADFRKTPYQLAVVQSLI